MTTSPPVTGDLVVSQPVAAPGSKPVPCSRSAPFSQAYYAREDWTNGCIAVSNSDMIDIWLMTPDRVPIEILP